MEEKLLWNNLQYLGHIFIPFFVLWFALEHTRTLEDGKRYLLIPMFVLSVTLWLIVATNSFHSLHYLDVVISDDPLRSFEPVHGPLYYVYFFVIFVELTAAAVISWRGYLRSRSIHRRRLLLLSLACLAPVLIAVAALLQWEQVPAAIVIIAGALVSSVLIFIGAYGFELFRMLPFTFDGTVRALTDGVIIVDDQRQLLYANPSFVRMMDKEDRNELGGLPLNDILPSFPLELLSMDGTEKENVQLMPDRYYDLKVTHISNWKGNAVSNLIILKEVSQRRIMELEVRRSQERFLKFFHSSPSPIMITSLEEGRVVEANESLATILGYSRAETIGRTVLELGFYTKAEDRERFLNLMKTKAQDQCFQNSFQIKDGSLIAVKMSSELIDIDGRPHILSVIEDITERLRKEGEILDRMKLLSMIADVSSNFITMQIGDIDRIIAATLAKIGQLYRVDRTYIFQFSPDGKMMSNSHEWCADGIEPQLQNLQGLSSTDLAWWTGKIQAKEVINIPYVDDMPPEATNEKEILQAQDIRSLLVLPMPGSGSVIGFIGFDSVGKVRKWTWEEVSVLQTLSNVITQALERQQADNHLRESEEKFRTLFDHAGDSIYISTLIGQILDVNRKTCERLKMRREDIIGLNFIDLIDPDEAWKISEAIQQLMLHGYASLEIEGTATDGTHLVVEANASTIQYGGQRAILVANRDISERKMAERALRLQKERLSVTLNCITDGVIVTDNDGRVVLMNRTAADMVGKSLSEARGILLDDLYSICDASGHATRSAAKEALETQSMSISLRRTLRGQGDTSLLINESASPLLENGTLLGVVLVLHDVTIEKELEDQTVRAAMLRSIGTLAGGIAHDFNNLLAMIVGQNEIMRREEMSKEDMIGRLEEGQKVLWRARELADRLLTFSKGGAPVRKAFTVLTLLQEAAALTKNHDNIEMIFNVPETVHLIELDEGQMINAVANIIRNAQEAMADGGTLTMSAVNAYLDGDGTEMSGGDYVHLTFADNGVGMNREVLSHIFEPYYTTNPSKSGMGLAVTYSVVKQHQGMVNAESEPGLGTIIHVYLPACRDCPLPRVEETIPMRTIQRAKVLLMDDEDVLMDVASEMLELLGHEAHQAHDGKEALTMYDQSAEEGRPYDLVIMDLTIPGGMGGKEAVKALKERHPDAKVIVSSGYSNDPVMSDHLSHGFDWVMPKPYTIKQLGSSIDHVLGRRGA
ncbi:MAG TPA: PAS domain S-box protein [Methanomassiliicoccales archaeon]|nr:PAS domain S-box protein [Methanomassiliicoccales archaeon]